MRTWGIELGRGEHWQILCGDGSRLNLRTDSKFFVFVVFVAVPKNHGQCKYPEGVLPIDSASHKPVMMGVLPLGRRFVQSTQSTGGTSGAALCIGLCVHISTTTFVFHLLSFHHNLVPLYVFYVSVFLRNSEFFCRS